MKYLTTFILLTPFYLFAQNSCEIESCEKKVTDKKIWTNAKYTGCVNLFDKPHGQGTREDNKGNKYSGCWKDGKEHGEMTIIYTDGFERYCVFKNGEEVKCRQIIENEYNPNDVITSMNSFDIDLIYNNDHDFIKLTIANKSDAFLYDTGASTNSMTKELFNSIPRNLYKKLYATGHRNSTLKLTQADGTIVKADYYLFKKIVIQDIEIHNVIFSVSKKGGSNLIGQDFWNKFSKSTPPIDGKITVYK